MNSNNSPITIENFLDSPTIKSSGTLEQVSEEACHEDDVPVSHVQDDYEFARRQLRDLILNGTTLLNDASNLASTGQRADHYEVASNILGQMINANKELLSLSATHQKVTGAGTKTAKVHNTAVFVGTTQELLDMMKSAKKNTDG